MQLRFLQCVNGKGLLGPLISQNLKKPSYIKQMSEFKQLVVVFLFLLKFSVLSILFWKIYSPLKHCWNLGSLEIVDIVGASVSEKWERPKQGIFHYTVQFLSPET